MLFRSDINGKGFSGLYSILSEITKFEEKYFDNDDLDDIPFLEIQYIEDINEDDLDEIPFPENLFIEDINKSETFKNRNQKNSSADLNHKKIRIKADVKLCAPKLPVMQNKETRI
jgi:hypothetical protein